MVANPGASTTLIQLIQSVSAPLPGPPILEAHSSEGRFHESATLPGPPRHSSAKAGHFIAPFPVPPESLHLDTPSTSTLPPPFIRIVERPQERAGRRVGPESSRLATPRRP